MFVGWFSPLIYFIPYIILRSLAPKMELNNVTNAIEIKEEFKR